MKHHLYAIPLAIIAALYLASCSGDTGPEEGLSDPGLSNVQTENAAARSAAITDEGGTLTVTGSNGAVYTLTIPPAALDSNVQISMYPISSINGYPKPGNMAAGVHLSPEGLTLIAPLTLTIDLPTGTDPKKLVGIASSANAVAFHGYPASIEGHRVILQINHFSQYTVGDASLDSLLGPAVVGRQLTPDELIQTRLAMAYNAFREDGTNPLPEYLRLLKEWYNTVLIAQIEQFGAYQSYEDVSFGRYDILRQYNVWLAAINFCQRTATAFVDVDAEVTDSRIRVAAALRNGVRVTNTECTRLAGTDPNGPSDPVVLDIARRASVALALQYMAEQWGVATAADSLDKETVLNGLVLKPVIESRTLPGNFGPNGVGNLDIHAGISILGRTVRHSIPLTIRLSNFSPASASPTTGQTNADGLFRSSIQWPSGLTTLRVDMLAILPHPLLGIGRYSISVFDRITKSSAPNPFVGTYLGSSSGTATTPNGDFDETGEFTATVISDGTLTASGTITRNILGLPPGPVGFTATGTVDASGNATISATAGSGQAACPFTFNGSFSLVPPDKVGGGTYDADCGSGVTSHGTWSCETQ